jgi:hypothetical protein
MSERTFKSEPKEKEMLTVGAETMASTAIPIARKYVKAKRGGPTPMVAESTSADPMVTESTDAKPMEEEQKELKRERRNPQRAARKRQAVLPALKITNPKGGHEGVCGYFTRTRQLYVSNATKPGVIVQKITREFKVTRFDKGTKTWIALPADKIDEYVGAGPSAYGEVKKYWEIWMVDKDGKVTNGVDEFGLGSIIPPGADSAHADNTSEGEYTITGEMYYYEAPSGDTRIDPGDLGFAEDVNHPAGKLLHRDDDPATALTGRGFVSRGLSVTFEVTVKWDSSSPDKVHSRVTMI